MTHLAPSCIGVDGGGTNCRLCLVIDGKRFEMRLGSANATTDPEAAIGIVRGGLESLATQAGVDWNVLATLPAYIGLAGVMTNDDSRRISDALGFPRAIVANDQATAVVGALGGRDGSIAATGTGSFFARKTGDRIRFVGGWGSVLADEASGSWLGRGLLAAALRAVDGLAAHSRLTAEVLREFDDDPGRVSTFAQNAEPRELAALAPRVVAAAGQGDVVARRLMQAGADHIREAFAALDRPAGEPICLIGGVGVHYRAYLPAEFQKSIVPPAGSALDGALRLAVEHGAAAGHAP